MAKKKTLPIAEAPAPGRDPDEDDGEPRPGPVDGGLPGTRLDTWALREAGADLIRRRLVQRKEVPCPS